MPIDTDEMNVNSLLIDTLALLSDVSDYLKKLPHVPVTRKLINRIEAHLREPQAATAKKLAERLAIEAQTRVAGAYTPAGLPLLEVAVRGDVVRVQIGEKAVRQNSIELLEAGCELRLK